MARVRIDGVDIEDWGLDPRDVRGWASGVQDERAQHSIPGVGQVAAGVAEHPGRTIEIECVLRADTVPEREEKLHAVDLQMSGALEVSFEDSGHDRVALCRYVSRAVEPIESLLQWQIGTSVVTLVLEADDPAIYDKAGQTLAFGSDAEEVTPMGTFPHRGMIEIHGAATNPVLRYRDRHSQVVASMTFTVSLGADEILRVNLDTRRVTKVESDGSEVGASALWTDGRFFDLDPGRGPKLEVTSGTGLYLYRRTWRS